jgi:hypothetical protein
LEYLITVAPSGLLLEFIGAAAIELTADDLREIEGALSAITVQGARYPEHLQSRVGR